MTPEARGRARAAAAVALAAALAATLGDFGMLWAVNAGRPALGLAPPPPVVVPLAALLGALALPLYGLGYWARACRVPAGQRVGRSRVTVGAGALAGAVGASVHATMGTLIANRVGEIASGLDPLEGIARSGPISLGLWAATAALLAVAGVAELGLAERRREWAFNPFLVLVALSLLAPLLPLPWRDFVGPAAANVAHAVFFARTWAKARAGAA